MRASRTLVEQTCAICERTLLVGERALRFAPHEGGELVDVCQLCADEAVE
jgi:predicted solute-binding protein